MIKLVERIKSSSLIKSFIVTLFGSGGSKLILVIATFYCTNHLSKFDYGEFSFVRNILNMILGVCALNFMGLSTKYTTEVSTNKNAIKKLAILFLFSLAICGFFGLLIWFLPYKLLLVIFESDNIIAYFKIIGVLLPVFIFQPLIEGLFKGLLKFNLVSYLQISSALMFLLLIIIGIKLKGVQGAVVGTILYYLLYSGVCIVLLFKIKGNLIQTIFNHIHGLSHEFQILYTMILPIFVMSFIDAPVFWGSQVLITNYGSMESIAGMSAINQLRNFAILIPAYFGTTFFAFASKNHAQGNMVLYYSQYQRMLRIFTFSSIGIVVFFIIFGKFILSIYGEEYISDYPALIICSLSIPFVMVANALRSDLIIHERQRFLLLVSIFWNILYLVALYTMLSRGVPPLEAYFICVFIGCGIQLIFYRYSFIKTRKMYGE